MNVYEQNVLRQVRRFEKSLEHTSSWHTWSKNMQQKVDGLIPQKVHQSLAHALEKGIKMFLEGSHLLRSTEMTAAQFSVGGAGGHSLREILPQARQLVQDYQKLATLEGAGTGFGGIIASTIDFPALISIKLKLMQELAYLYGYSMDNFRERVFILRIIQLQFSGQEGKRKVWPMIKYWGHRHHADDGANDTSGNMGNIQSWEAFDWEEFYLDYKQSIELPKLLQIIPGFGAIVGAWANSSFLDQLGKTAILCFQLRKLQEKYGVME